MLVDHWVLQGFVNCKSSWKRQRFVFSQLFSLHMPISLIAIILLLALCDCGVRILATFKRSCRQEILGYHVRPGRDQNLSKSLLMQGSLCCFECLSACLTNCDLVLKRVLLCQTRIMNIEYHTFIFMIHLHFAIAIPQTQTCWQTLIFDLWIVDVISPIAAFSRAVSATDANLLCRAGTGGCAAEAGWGWFSPTWLWPSQVGTPKLKVSKGVLSNSFQHPWIQEMNGNERDKDDKHLMTFKNCIPPAFL